MVAKTWVVDLTSSERILGFECVVQLYYTFIPLPCAESSSDLNPYMNNLILYTILNTQVMLVREK